MTSSVEQTVFIVDDDVAVRDALALLLGLKGYRTSIYSSAEDFLAAYRREWRGCLVLDIKLNNESGIDLRYRLSAAGISLPVIYITADDSPSVRTAAIESGCIAYLIKPFWAKSLIEPIERLAASAA